jgi:hypothetical protein
LEKNTHENKSYLGPPGLPESLPSFFFKTKQKITLFSSLYARRWDFCSDFYFYGCEKDLNEWNEEELVELVS